jgi:hypothetical protein
VSTLLQNAADFRELLRDDVADERYVFREIFSDAGWRQRSLSKKRLKLLKRLAPALEEILWDDERVLFLTRGVMARFLEWYLLGWALYYLARRAIIVTDRRIVLLQINRRGKPGELVSQIDESAVAEVTSTFTGYTRVTFRNGGQVLFAGVPRPERKRLAELTAALSSAPAPMKSLRGEVQHLCPHCFVEISDRPLSCPECGGALKSSGKAAVLSLILPGAGVAALTWMGLIALASDPTMGPGGYVFMVAFTVLLIHGADALATRYVARKGLHPDWPGPRGDWWRFAAAAAIPGVALFWAGRDLAEKTALAPVPGVVSGADLSALHRSAMVDAGLIDADEEVILFFSNGPVTILAHGSVLTDRRVVSYAYDLDSLLQFTARYDEIMDAAAYRGGLGEPLSTIVVARSDGDGLVLVVPAGDVQDQLFMDTLTARWRQVREASQADGFWFAGGSGESIDDPAVLRGGADGSPSRWAETIWISMRLGEPDLEWQMESQNRRTVGDRTIDEITVVDVDGEAYTMYFDVTEALGHSGSP